MKQAILAAEDERFYQHGGVDYVGGGARRARQPRGRHPAGRRHDHDAGGAQLLPHPREDRHPQALARCCSPSRSRPTSPRTRSSSSTSTRSSSASAPTASRRRRSIYFGKTLGELTVAEAAMLAGPAEGAVALQPRHEPEARARRGSSTCCGGCMTLRCHQRRPVPRSTKCANRRSDRRSAEVLPVHADYVAEMARQVVFDAVRRRGLHERPHGLDHDPPRRPGRRLRGRAQGRDRLRPAPRLSRPGELREPAATTRPSRSRRSTARSQDRDRQRRARSPPSCCRSRPREVQGGAAAAATRSRVTGDGLKFAARGARRQDARRPRIRRGAIIRCTRDDKGTWTHRAAAAGRGRVPRRSTRPTARSSRWSAASTSTATSSTT